MYSNGETENSLKNLNKNVAKKIFQPPILPIAPNWNYEKYWSTWTTEL